MRNHFIHRICFVTLYFQLHVYDIAVSVQTFVVYAFHLYRLFFIYDVLRIVFFLVQNTLHSIKRSGVQL